MLHHVPAAVQVLDAAVLAGWAEGTRGGAGAVVVGWGASICATLSLSVGRMGVWGAGRLTHGLDLDPAQGLDLDLGLDPAHGLVALRCCCGCAVPVMFPQEDGCGELRLGEHLCEAAAAAAAAMALLLVLLSLLLPALLLSLSGASCVGGGGLSLWVPRDNR